jgi:hypothetical protein
MTASFNISSHEGEMVGPNVLHAAGVVMKRVVVGIDFRPRKSRAPSHSADTQSSDKMAS